MNEKLTALRRLMKERGVDLYIVPTDDFHLSEYTGDHFKCRAFLMGFRGSAGTALVTQEEALLWTDGRYFLAAEEELRGSGFSLMKMGVEGVPTLSEYVKAHLKEGSVLGYDGRTVSAQAGKQFLRIAEEQGARIADGWDLVGEIWTDRPLLSHEAAWILGTEYAGEDSASKIERVRSAMRDRGAKAHVLTGLTDISWLLNLRGGDILYCPVVLSYLVLTENRCMFYVQRESLSEEICAYLQDLGVEVRPYEAVYEDASGLEGPVLVDDSCINARLYTLLSGHTGLVEAKNPTILMKAVKNEVEAENFRIAHLKDGVVLTKWLYWFKHTVGKEALSELSCARKLDAMRRAVDSSKGLSFETIAGYGPNGAIVHYEPTEESDTPVEAKGFLLVDSGGHYLEGTTDVTRTISCGPLSEKEKEYFTLVLKGHIDLASAKFLEGARGMNLDYLARAPFWERGLDYRHGTGHGVGYLLSVHESPNGFRWKVVPERNDSAEFVPGMIQSDEPGIYLAGEFGVRTESLLLTVEAEKTEFGRFLAFENLTLCPIDLDAIVPEMLNKEEKAYLNNYHETVYQKLCPFMNEEEAAWLREATRAI
ncbi:MAG: aminopeptidase P family protein [Lachnospiraceae bacterium]|nr:aminopeptidase P family protein [Lachnospiraceae bacterium]